MTGHTGHAGQRPARARSVWPYRFALIALCGVGGGLVFTLAQALAETGSDWLAAQVGGVVGAFMLFAAGLMVVAWCLMGFGGD